MALTTAFPGPSGVVDTTLLRKDLAGLIVRDVNGVPRAGVLPRHTNPLVTSRATLGVDVAAFEAALVRGNGPLFIQNDGTVTVPIGAAPSSNSRYDIVYVKQNESVTPYSDANNNPVFGFVSGTAAASPSLSAALALVPAGGLPLASVLVPSTATTTQSAGVVITPAFPYTAMTGGTVVFRNAAERDASNLGEAQRGYLMDTDAFYANVGALGWQHDGGKPEITTVTLNSLYVAYGAPFTAPRVDRQGGRVALNGFLKNTVTVSYAAATSYVIGNIPSTLAPLTTQYFSVYANDVITRVSVDSAGEIRWLAPATATYTAGNIYINLDGASWAAKQLG